VRSSAWWSFFQAEKKRRGREVWAVRNILIVVTPRLNPRGCRTVNILTTILSISV
jgi:hypothetical protein